MGMVQTPLQEDAQLVAIQDKANQTTEVYLYNGRTHYFIGMTGSDDQAEHDRLVWLAHSAASFHKIPFEIQEADNG